PASPGRLPYPPLFRSLRLAVDPSARAELARLPEIGEVDVRDVTPERVADYLDFFDHSAFRDFPAWQSCYCMETHRDHTDEEWSEDRKSTRLNSSHEWS